LILTGEGVLNLADLKLTPYGRIKILTLLIKQQGTPAKRHTSARARSKRRHSEIAYAGCCLTNFRS